MTCDAARRPAYRPDIDGLRALAVLSVLVFHVNPAWLPGGFVGVDIFFVISGFLITQILVREMDGGQFSLSRFIERRIKRILPALVVLLTACLAAGTVLLTPGELSAMATSAIWAVLSVGNVYFKQNTGYFDNAAEMMPLLHTWSLGVEEQFYLVWPLLLLGLYRLLGGRRSAIVAVCVALLAISLARAVWVVSSDPKAAFFLADSRAWELGAGAVVALLPWRFWRRQERFAVAAGVIGLALIGISLFALDKATAFPGWAAIPPVLGSALLVAPWARATLAARLLSLSPVVAIGLVSYSLYLWHWPILAFYRHYTSQTDAIGALPAFGLMGMALAVAWLSWRFVEQPIRNWRFTPRAHIAGGMVAAGMLVTAAVAVVHSGGLPGRIPPQHAGLVGLKEMWQWDCPSQTQLPGIDKGRSCVLGAPWESGRTRVLLWGDSHAQHYAPLLDVVAREAGVSVVMSDWNCVPFVSPTGVRRHLPSQPAYAENCQRAREQLLSLMGSESGAGLVIIAAAWTRYPAELHRPGGGHGSASQGLDLMREGLDEHLRDIAARGGRGVVLSQWARRLNKQDASCLLGGQGLWRPACEAEFDRIPRMASDALHGETDAVIRSLPARWPHVQVLMPRERMCDQDRCPVFLDGTYLYRDESHIRRNLDVDVRRKLADLLGLRAIIEDEARRAAKRRVATVGADMP